jgi:uncharacterized protein YidB (DUF937 family)
LGEHREKSPRHTGSDHDAASAQLSSVLPGVIDKATPNGKIEAGGIDQLLKMFQGKIGA